MLELQESKNLNGMTPSPKEKNSTIEKENSKRAKDNRRMKEFKPKELPQEPSPWRKRKRPMQNAHKRELRPKPPNWPSRRPVKPRNALKEKPGEPRPRHLKPWQQKQSPRLKTLIAVRKRKLLLNQEKTRVERKK